MEFIDPNLIPARTLYTGAKMPAVGMGTFGSDHATKLRSERYLQRLFQKGRSDVRSCLLFPKCGMTCMDREMYFWPVQRR